jgi:phosphopantothenoylcysteine decarboxylase / phosphopantothenate---cysteine ligase
MFANKTVVLGVTGGIAAYKAADLASKLTQSGAKVRVVMTKAALEFVTPLTFEAITANSVITDMFRTDAEHRINHVALSEVADVIVIAPATADIIAKIAGGIADEMLTTTVLATRAPVVIVPAMHTGMWLNQVTQENAAKLKSRGFYIVEPAVGRLASGGYGAGRFPDTETILGHINKVLGQKGDLAGKRMVITSGGTQEPIDPVRLITNRSSGRMGYALAEAARDRGADVTLITAPTNIPRPAAVELIDVQTVSQMKAAVEKAVVQADALIMAAAVSDFQAKDVPAHKIKKENGGLTLELVKTADILSAVKGNFIKVGFAAESQDLIANARRKVKNKHLDLIVANNITEKNSGFSVDTNKVTIIDKSGETTSLPLMSKREVADKVLDRIVKMLAE